MVNSHASWKHKQARFANMWVLSPGWEQTKTGNRLNVFKMGKVPSLYSSSKGECSVGDPFKKKFFQINKKLFLFLT